MEKKEALQLRGFCVEELPNLKEVGRGDFLNKDGVRMRNLPTDPYHLARWRARGFTPAPPEEKIIEPYKCAICGEINPDTKHMVKHTQI